MSKYYANKKRRINFRKSRLRKLLMSKKRKTTTIYNSDGYFLGSLKYMLASDDKEMVSLAKIIIYQSKFEDINHVNDLVENYFHQLTK